MDIRELTVSIIQGQLAHERGGESYLRALCAAAQDAIGKKRGTEQPAQLAALQGAQETFYEQVLEAARSVVPKGTKAAEVHRRVNFARTAASALRRWIRAGNDLATLTAQRVTKGMLRVAPAVRAPSAARLKTSAERQSKTLIATLMGLLDTDRGAAQAEIELIVGQLSRLVEKPPRRRSAAHHETHAGVQ